MQLGALIQHADGGGTAAIDRLREAAAIEEKTPFEFGPPFIDKPSHELLGETLLAAGRGLPGLGRRQLGGGDLGRHGGGGQDTSELPPADGDHER